MLEHDHTHPNPLSSRPTRRLQGRACGGAPGPTGEHTVYRPTGSDVIDETNLTQLETHV